MTNNLTTPTRHHSRLKALIARIRYFDCLPPEVQERIAAIAVPCHFDAGQVIYVEGEPAESIYILEGGWVKATRMTREGREQAMMFLRPVEIFGDISVFTGTTYPGTVVALEAVEAWSIPAKMILDLITYHPELAMAIILQDTIQQQPRSRWPAELSSLSPVHHCPARCRPTHWIRSDRQRRIRLLGIIGM